MAKKRREVCPFFSWLEGAAFERLGIDSQEEVAKTLGIKPKTYRANRAQGKFPLKSLDAVRQLLGDMSLSASKLEDDYKVRFTSGRRLAGEQSGSASHLKVFFDKADGRLVEPRLSLESAVKNFDPFASLGPRSFFVLVTSTVMPKEMLTDKNSFWESAARAAAAGSKLLNVFPSKSHLDELKGLVGKAGMEDFVGEWGKFRREVTGLWGRRGIGHPERRFDRHIRAVFLDKCPFFIPGFVFGMVGDYGPADDERNDLYVRMTVRMPEDKIGGGIIPYPACKSFTDRFLEMSRHACEARGCENVGQTLPEDGEHFFSSLLRLLNQTRDSYRPDPELDFPV